MKMVDLTLVSGIAGTLKTAVDIAKTVKEVNDMSTVKGKVIEMQDLILAAQSSAMTAQTQLFELLQENAELKRKVSDIEGWKNTAARYTLKDFGGKTFAYELKAEAAVGEPPHRVCPACFEMGKRSVLQFQNVTASRQDFYKCMPCGQDYFFGVSDESVWEAPRRDRELW
ncbi:hypothetical protein [Agrobacterium rosae]|uniref:hypothetical protein n=1 Tax=Agrobacterium rosae TaxID=1972867 RepID=UPI000CD9E337|nr:hypothetical protein [Agrobacterium rosae]POO56165.1 hypothetical protein CTT39_05310 [Agrobacterium rosae]